MGKYCVIGKSLSHTLSPEIHKNFGLSYFVEEMEEGEIRGFLERKEYDGFNVTVPYKKVIIPLLDEVHPTALKIGAVNTVVLKDGRYIGYNTDYKGMEYAIERGGLTLKGKNVLILGTGGASMVAEHLALNHKAKSVIKVGRTSEVNYSNVYDYKDSEVIINTTPVGMSPNLRECPVELERFSRLKGVFDAIYNPLETELIRRAKVMGVKAQNGLAMLVEQARLARDIFVGDLSDSTLTERVLDILYKKSLNIVLIGMPSSGKSTIGRLLSERVNKKYVDLDEVFVKREGISIEEFFKKYSESEFRAKEKALCFEYASGLNQVIATGGGTVMDRENFIELSRNGVIVYVDRPLNLLVDAGRPISKAKGVEQIYQERREVYEQGDFKVVNDKSLEKVVKEIIDYEENLSY